jgi:hypothetical protein
MFDKLKQDNKGLVELVYIAVYLGIAVAAGAIVLFITSKVVDITGTPTNSHLSNASENLMDTADTGYSFLPIVAVAAIGAIAIGYVFGLIPGMGAGKDGMI